MAADKSIGTQQIPQKHISLFNLRFILPATKCTRILSACVSAIYLNTRVCVRVCVGVSVMFSYCVIAALLYLRFAPLFLISRLNR